MNQGEILDRTFQIYRRQFWPFVVVAAVPALVVEGISLADAYWFHLYSLASSDNHSRTGLFMLRMVFSIGFYHFSSLIGALLFPVILKLVSGSVLNEEINIREAWRFFGARWPRYLGLSALKLFAGLVIVEVLTVLLLALTMEGLDELGAQSFLDGPKSFIILALWIAAGFATFLWIDSSLSLATPSAASENLKAFRALRRSWTLTRGTRLRIALTWIPLAIGAWMLSGSSQWVLRLVVIMAARSTHSRWIGYILYPILSRTMNTALNALFGPIYPIAITLFYYDQRIRREGYDIERMMDSAGMIAPTNPPEGTEILVPEAAGEAHS
jgi:hypothetical protein